MPRGTGHVYQKRGREIWYIQYGHNGRVYYESSRSRRKKDAIALLKKRLAEISSGRHAPDAERVTFDQLAETIERDYRVNRRRSIRRLRTSLKQLREFFGGDRARDVTTERINRYVDRRQSDGRANSTIQNELSALKRMFTLAVQNGVLNVAPYVPSLRVNNARQGFFTDGDLDRVLNELPPYLRAPTRFAYLTGWRKEEVLSREWSHVDFEAGEVRLWESKNDDPRVFPFAVLPALKLLLEEQRERTREIERRGGVIVRRVFHRDGHEIKSMKNAWNNATERAGLDGWLFHDLRRSAVRNLEAAGVPRSVAMKLTGHKTEAVYRRYAIADAAALREGVAKLARLHELPPEPSKVIAIGIQHG